ncbi:MAG: prepilin-type N-terminal cleavage/methylation domain-containing protein, partial [Myxococcota bacterium]
MRNERGFTLAEVMIALSIMALIGTLTYGVFNRTLAAREQANRITEHYHMVRQAMLRMSREVSMAFITPFKDCEDPRTETQFIGDRSGSSHRLDFTSFGHFKTRADANESDQNELSYFVTRDPDEKKGKVLMRREDPVIDDEPDEGGVEQVLARGVESLELEFYDQN